MTKHDCFTMKYTIYKNLFFTLLFLLPAYTASIDWESPRNVINGSDILVSGYLVEAYNLGGGSVVSDVTVNGVSFGSRTDLLSGNVNIDVLSSETSDVEYNTLLSTIDTGGGTDTVTLEVGGGDLVSGVEYHIQVWYLDQRFSSRVTPVGDGTGNTVDLSSSGQHVTGRFVADSHSQIITLDSPGFGNAHCNAYQIRLLSDTPVPFLETQSDIVSEAFEVSLGFSEDVTGLEESDFIISNGTVVPGSLTGTGASYVFQVEPLRNGEVILELPSNAVTSTDGSTNTHSAELSVNCFFVGSDYATAYLSSELVGVSGAFLVNIEFSEGVSGLSLDDFVVSNGESSQLTIIDDQHYSITITPQDEGPVRINLPEGSVVDLDGDSLGNLPSNRLEVYHDTSPQLALYGVAESFDSTFKVHLTSSIPIEGLDEGDILVSGGQVLLLEGEGRREFADRYFTLTLQASSTGALSIRIPTGSYYAKDNGSIWNSEELLESVLCRADFSDEWVIDTQAEWDSDVVNSSGFAINGGQALTSEDSATFTSRVRQYAQKRSVSKLGVRQSDVWDYWVDAGKLTPTGAGNAPVLLPVAEGDYYLLAQKGNDGYHAWHSTDMVNWTQYGQVTAPEHNWVTSAEYKEGVFYIYVDYPNDHTPHLYVDTDLKDGLVGDFVGMVFDNPISGSDNAVIRDDLDGLFHMVCEDYSCLHANSHAFDSPLATHTSSLDGITGYGVYAHPPVIDRRTEPSGHIQTFSHPHVEGTHIQNPQYYMEHEPHQDAFGDWTAIKIGSQYYLFGDYHHADGTPINTAIFTSDSLYEEFELVGSLGDGHPDPSVCFAEGQFYLFTQTGTDYTSPGPWVDGVMARVGVDIDGDSVIDEWSDWSSITESYSQKTGYARVVNRTPAELDVSELPSGYGFCFEVRVDNTVIDEVAPIIDKVTLTYEPSYYQKWANERSIEASVDQDFSGNGQADLIDFAFGEAFNPSVQEDGTLVVKLSSEAFEDGVDTVLEYSEDLSSWKVASSQDGDLKITHEELNTDGSYDLTLSVDQRSPELFWRVKVIMP